MSAITRKHPRSKQVAKSVPVKKIVSDPWADVKNYADPITFTGCSQLLHDIVHSFEGRVFLYRFHACGRRHYLANGSKAVLEPFQFNLTPWGQVALRAWLAGFEGIPFPVWFKCIDLPPAQGCNHPRHD